MNMWGLTPQFIDGLESEFKLFLAKLAPNDITSEFLLPTIIDTMIKTGKAEVTLLESRDKWFGVTYKEDKQTVVDEIRKLVESGEY